MAQQVTACAPSPPPGCMVATHQSNKRLPSFSGVALYHESLRPALEKIHKACPEIFEGLHEAVGGPIRIQVHVDVPIVNKNWFQIFAPHHVKAEDLRGKGIKILDDTEYLETDILRKRGISVGSEGPRSAEWNWEHKVITVRHDLGEQRLISSLMFELQNALSTLYFKQILESGRVNGKEWYVQSFERVELVSAQEASRCLDQMKTWNPFRFTYPQFDLFYLHQQAVNHSQQYAVNHDKRFGTEKNTPYRGTWPVSLSTGERQELGKILELHLDALFDTPAKAVIAQKKLPSKVAAASGNVLECLEFFQRKCDQYPDTITFKLVENLV